MRFNSLDLIVVMQLFREVIPPPRFTGATPPFITENM
jgi:hypothetical protein